MNIKKLALAFFATVTTGSVVTIAAVSNSNSIFAMAQECDHVGNHYTRLASTAEQSGTKEYWVCCICHEHFLSEPQPLGVYTWEEAGVASQILDENDDRYVAPGSVNSIQDLIDLGYKNVKAQDDGTFSIGKYDAATGGYTVIIPEGVSKIDGNCFPENITWVVFPKTLTTLSGNAFASLKTCTLYFVGDAVAPKVCSGAKAYYANQGQGWDYNASGVPQAL